MKKKVPYAIANLEQMREENAYFVDKTKYLEKLENYTAPVFLRPRRFGKTLMCSIQECYYDIKRKDKFEELFGDTYIGQNPTSERNKYMVLRLNFSTVEVSNDINLMQQSFFNRCNDKLDIFLAYYKEFFKEDIILTSSATDNLNVILKAIKKHNLPQMYVIIDEYDNFSNQLITSHKDTLYQNLTSDDSFLFKRKLEIY